MSDLQCVLLECEYFPCISWYRNFLLHEQIIIEQCENFQRASLRNRCYVAGPNGKLALSVPLQEGRNQKTLMKDVKISYREKWQHVHWRTLLACYNRTPYFEYFQHLLEPLFEKKYTYLMDLNINSLQAMNQCVSVKKEISLTENFLFIQPTEILDLRYSFNAANSEDGNAISYIQPFEEKNGFIKGLSMLDMLFCTGKQATELLLSS